MKFFIVKFTSIVAYTAIVILCIGTSDYSAQNLKIPSSAFWYWHFFRTRCNACMVLSLLTGIRSHIFFIAELSVILLNL